MGFKKFFSGRQSENPEGYVGESLDDPTLGELGRGPRIVYPDSPSEERTARGELARDPLATPPSEDPRVNLVAMWAKLRSRDGGS